MLSGSAIKVLFARPPGLAYLYGSFEKGQIVVQCHISGTRGPRKVFKLNETSLRSKESFAETDEAVSARICVVAGDSTKGKKSNGKFGWKTGIVSVNAGHLQADQMGRENWENCYIFSFDHLEEIKTAVYKSYQVP